jgi:Zn-dependent peptidase ImmA (M78 family)
VPNPYDEPRAHQLREAYHAAFGGDELPVPVESIAEDLLGLAIEVTDDLPVSGMLIPSERRIVVRSDEPEPRRRFTIAHELGHWICQCLEGDMQPVYCRAGEIGVDAAAKALEREANIFAANLLMPEPIVRSAWAQSGAVGAAASRFGVSPEAMEWRLFSFGCVSDPRAAEQPPDAGD